MEAFPSYQSQYQTSHYPLDVPTDLKDANDTGFPNVLSPKNRLHHSLSYPPAASGRSPRNHEVQVARARSRLQTRTSPPAVVRMVSRSPGQQQNALLDSASAFPLPYRPPKTAAHYSSPPIESYSSPTIPLTSQDTRSYYSSPPFQASPPGRFLGFDDSQTRNSKLDPPGYFSPSPNWQQTRDSKWPQSRSQSRRKYIPKGRRYDSPFHQRNRLGPPHGHFTPPRKHQPLLPADGYKKRLSGQFYPETTEQLPQPPRLARWPLPSCSLGDQKDASTPERVAPGCVSQYISPENTDASIQSIRNSKYWLKMKDDPIFSSNLSIKSELVSIEELVNRRVQLLQDHANPSPRPQSIMKEQGTQTDIESPALFSYPERPTTASQKRRVLLTSNTPKHEQQVFAPPPPSPQQKQQHCYHNRQQFPKEKSSSTKDGNRNRHSRTSSLTDTDSPRITHAQQPTTSPRMGSLKRSRSDTEDDYYMSDSCHRRRAEGTTLSPGDFFSQRARTPFYTRRR